MSNALQPAPSKAGLTVCEIQVLYLNRMPTPIYALRLSKETQEKIAALAKVYGSPSARAFAREILDVVTSGDMLKLQAFNERLMTRMVGQTFLPLALRTPGTNPPPEPVPSKKRKKRRPRDRTT